MQQYSHLYPHPAARRRLGAIPARNRGLADGLAVRHNRGWINGASVSAARAGWHSARRQGTKTPCASVLGPNGGTPVGKTDPSQQRRAGLQKEIAELEEQLVSLKASLPVHSLSPAMFQQVEDLEYKIKQKRAALDHEKPQPDSQSND